MITTIGAVPLVVITTIIPVTRPARLAAEWITPDTSPALLAAPTVTCMQGPTMFASVITAVALGVVTMIITAILYAVLGAAIGLTAQRDRAVAVPPTILALPLIPPPHLRLIPILVLVLVALTQVPSQVGIRLTGG